MLSSLGPEITLNRKIQECSLLDLFSSKLVRQFFGYSGKVDCSGNCPKRSTWRSSCNSSHPRTFLLIPTQPLAHAIAVSFNTSTSVRLIYSQTLQPKEPNSISFVRVLLRPTTLPLSLPRISSTYNMTPPELHNFQTPHPQLASTVTVFDLKVLTCQLNSLT